MSKFGYLERMNRPRLCSIVAGALRSAIHAHGEITTTNAEAAAHRIVSQLLAAVSQDIEREKRQRSTVRDEDFERSLLDAENLRQRVPPIRPEVKP